MGVPLARRKPEFLRSGHKKPFCGPWMVCVAGREVEMPQDAAVTVIDTPRFLGLTARKNDQAEANQE